MRQNGEKVKKVDMKYVTFKKRIKENEWEFYLRNKIECDSWEL